MGWSACRTVRPLGKNPISPCDGTITVAFHMLPTGKKVPATLLIVLVTILAFGAGVFVQRHTAKAQVRVAEQFARELTGINDPVPAAPGWDEWHYPNGKWRANRPGVGVRISGQLVRPAGYSGLMITPDPFEEVAQHYAEKASFAEPEKVATSLSGIFDSGNLQGELNLGIDDSEDGTDSAKMRSVRAKCLVRRCPSYDLVVFLTRADDDRYTHIMLVYHPKTDTVQANNL